MAASRGSASRDVEGCRCGDCTNAHRITARDYRRRKAEAVVLDEAPDPVGLELGAA
jgi:hypothetical protein